MTTEVNLSAVLLEKNNLKLEPRPIPVPGDYEVLLRMQFVGICGSDVHYLRNGRIGDFIVKAPMVLGHESSGVVVKCGSKVKHLKAGDRVAVEPGVPCRRCDQCLGGRYNLCPDIVFCATPPVDGSLCRYYVHDADFCYKLPDHVSLEEGALLEPLAVGVHACRRANVGVQSKVLVCGAGPIGLVNFMVAKAMGATSICITDMVESRLKVASSLGVDHTILIKGSDTQALVDEVHAKLGGQPDITLECSGAASSIELGILATKSGGTLLLVGMGAPTCTVPLINAAVREVDIRGVFRYANCYPLALSLVATKKVNVLPLITHKYQLKETLAAFETAATPASGAIKVMISCD